MGAATVDVIRRMFRFAGEVVAQRRLIASLVRRELSQQYAGSTLGVLWGVIQPIITILIFWLLFEAGFRVTPMEEIPFLVWLSTGIIVWFFFSDAVSNGLLAVIDKAFLVKKTLFRVPFLPVIKVITAVIFHLLLVGLLMGLFLIYGVKPTLQWLQFPYYLAGAFLLSLGLAYFTSALTVFIPDVQRVVGVLLQFGFWLTPTFWPIGILPEEYRWVVELNPLYYLVDGYRGAFLYGSWFWETPGAALYFWGVTGGLFTIGALTFRRLRPHFAELL